MSIPKASALRAATCAGALWMCCAVALAGPLAQTHDGFFLRLNLLGVGGTSTTGDDGTLEVEFKGVGSMGDLSIGGMITENFALHGSLFGYVVSDPEGESGSASADFNGTITMGALGIGVTRYFMPSNFYLSGVVGIGGLGFELDGLPSHDTDAGFAMQVLFGKEWWVGDNWGLGIAGVAGLHSISDEDGGAEVDWGGGNIGAQFSVTFN